MTPGVKIETIGFFLFEEDDFFNILERNLKIRHNVSPTHTVEELIKIHDLFPERCNLFGAFIGGKMIAGVVNFIINSEVVLAFYISHNEEHKEKRPVNLLFYHIFDWAIKSNYKIYDLRNLYSPTKMKKNNINYYSVGR